MAQAALSLVATLNRSPLEARRGIVRMHPLVLDALGVRPWDAVELHGQRATGAMAAIAPPDSNQAAVLMDDLICANAGVAPGDSVALRRAEPPAAASVSLTGLPPAAKGIDAAALRLAMLGKVVIAGDRVSLLPQDFFRPGAPGQGGDVTELVARLNRDLGAGWQQAILKVDRTLPAGLVRITMETTLLAGGVIGDRSEGARVVAPLSREDLPGLEAQFDSLSKKLRLAFEGEELLDRLGAGRPLGILITGPAGSGKVRLTEAVAAAAGAQVVHLSGHDLAAGTAEEGSSAIRDAFGRAEGLSPAILLIEDVDAIAPREEPGPMLPALINSIEQAVAQGRTAVVCTTAHPEATNPRLRSPGVLEHEIEIPLPQRGQRLSILQHSTRGLPIAPDVNLQEVAARTPGFVAADLLALCRDAALKAAERLQTAAGEASTVITGADFEAALQLVRPTSMGGTSLEIADVRLADVGDMEEVKQQLTEALLMPLRHPESFERLGIEPPRGILIFGPPGCGKTFLIKAFANEGDANFLSVKGAELLSKWVGESERAVVELFRRARNAAPAIIFFDEIDALAPIRGQSGDSDATDRVVAQLLTELDGVEDLRDVAVVAATNRPELIDPALLRPGRLERFIFIPPPDAVARTAILKAIARKTPCTPDVDLAALAVSAEGYSPADLEAVTRSAAMIAMREDINTPFVTAAHWAEALQQVKPSLTPEVIAKSKRFLTDRAT